MTYAPTSPFRKRSKKRPPAPHAAGTRWIEIFAPNRDSTDLLLLYASLVQRWLESARLPWANMLYDGGSYLIRRSTEFAQFAAATQSTTHQSPGQVRSLGGWTYRPHDVPRALGGSSEARDGCS